MGILGNLWLGKLLARGLPRWLIAGSIGVGMILVHTLVGRLDNDDGWLWNVTDSIYLGLFAWLILYCASRSDQDLLDSSLSISEQTWAARSHSLRDARIETAVALFVGVLIAGFSWFIEIVDPDVAAIRSQGERVTLSVRWIIDSMLFYHLISMIIRERRWQMSFIDRELEIDLLHVDDLSVLSSGFVRWIAVEACVVSMYVVALVLLRDPNPYEFLRILAGAGLISILVILLFTPILKTRNKIIEAKERDRSIATLGLQGTPVNNGELAIVSNSDHYSTTELLSYLSYLDGLWEWPMHRKMARLVFYALIPPAVWVLSVLAEVMLELQLQ